MNKNAKNITTKSSYTAVYMVFICTLKNNAIGISTGLSCISNGKKRKAVCSQGYCHNYFRFLTCMSRAIHTGVLTMNEKLLINEQPYILQK